MKPPSTDKEAEVIRTLPAPSEIETLILLSAPSATLPYYAEAFDKIIDFEARFAGLTSGREKVVVLANKTTVCRIKNRARNSGWCGSDSCQKRRGTKPAMQMAW